SPYATNIASYAPDASASASLASTLAAISRGVLWSLPGRHWSVTWVQPFRSITASTSRAIAPHATTSTRPEGPPASASNVTSSSSSRGGTAGHHQGLGGLGSDGGIATIRVGTHRLAEFLVQGCAADQHDVVVADALLDHRVDHDLHVRHRRGEQRGHAQDVGLVLLERGQVLLDGVVDAQVDHVEPGALQHH